MPRDLLREEKAVPMPLAGAVRQIDAADNQCCSGQEGKVDGLAEDPGVAVEPLDEILPDAVVAAVELDGVIAHLVAYLTGEVLRHRHLLDGVPARLHPGGDPVVELPGDLHLRGHVDELVAGHQRRLGITRALNPGIQRNHFTLIITKNKITSISYTIPVLYYGWKIRYKIQG